MRRIPAWVLILTCGIILSVALILYFVRFHGGLATEQGIFGSFGDYLNPFLTLISIVLLGYISLRANEITQTFNQVQLEPQLYLGMESSNVVPNDEDWVIRNGYEAPAINILVRIRFNRNTNDFTRWVNCFSMAKELKKELVWIRFPDEIQVFWSNMRGNRFFRIVYRDWNGILDSKLSMEEYNGALVIARSHRFNTNALLSRDFNNHFYQVNAPKQTMQNYIAYLQQRGLL